MEKVRFVAYFSEWKPALAIDVPTDFEINLECRNVVYE